MIKNIIFDFGDVFLNLDKAGPSKVLKQKGIDSVTKEDEELLRTYEVGKVTSEEVILHFNKNYSLKNDEFKWIWNSMLLDFPDYRFDFLKNLKSSNKYRLFLLSNTNEIHIDWVKEDWGMERYDDFKSCFEKFYLSHEIHLRKPNADIYEFVLSENQLKPDETFFIDDTKVNTDAASAIGIKTWNIDPRNEDITNLISMIKP
jgi:putative hydrolase of the HAD superfamily